MNTSQNDTPGKLDHTYFCGRIVERDQSALPRKHILLSGSYRTLEIVGMDFEFCVNGVGVHFQVGKRYRITIEEVA